jgi:hypothetical protein
LRLCDPYPEHARAGLAGVDRLGAERVTHEDLADDTELRDAASGWSAVLSNLKTLLETGSPLP